MQVTPPRCSRLGLALVLLLVSGASVQGYPTRKAKYQWVRCKSGSNSINCIDHEGPTVELPPGEDNRIFPLRADLTSRIRPRNMNDIFPVSEDFSGSGSGSGSGDGFLQNDIEDEFHLIHENAAPSDSFRLKRSLPGGEHNLDQVAQEADFDI